MNTAHENAPLLHAKQAMRLLNVSRSTLSNLQRAGVIRPVRLLGNVVRYRRSDLEALIAGEVPEAKTSTAAKPRTYAGRKPGRPRKRPVDEV